MKIPKGLIVLCALNFSLCTSLNAMVRNPFEFLEIEAATPKIRAKDQKSRWNIKEHDDKIVILENTEDGQIMTVEIPYVND